MRLHPARAPPCLCVLTNPQVMSRARHGLAGALISASCTDQTRAAAYRRVSQLTLARAAGSSSLDDGEEIEADVVVATIGDQPDTQCGQHRPGGVGRHPVRAPSPRCLVGAMDIAVGRARQRRRGLWQRGRPVRRGQWIAAMELGRPRPEAPARLRIGAAGDAAAPVRSNIYQAVRRHTANQAWDLHYRDRDTVPSCAATSRGWRAGELHSWTIASSAHRAQRVGGVHGDDPFADGQRAADRLERAQPRDRHGPPTCGPPPPRALPSGSGLATADLATFAARARRGPRICVTGRPSLNLGLVGVGYDSKRTKISVVAARMVLSGQAGNPKAWA